MAKPTLYKKKALQDIKNRPTGLLTADETTSVNNVMSNFFSYFKTKHLS